MAAAVRAPEDGQPLTGTCEGRGEPDVLSLCTRGVAARSAPSPGRFRARHRFSTQPTIAFATRPRYSFDKSKQLLLHSRAKTSTSSRPDLEQVWTVDRSHPAACSRSTNALCTNLKNKETRIDEKGRRRVDQARRVPSGAGGAVRACECACSSCNSRRCDHCTSCRRCDRHHYGSSSTDPLMMTAARTTRTSRSTRAPTARASCGCARGASSRRSRLLGCSRCTRCGSLCDCVGDDDGRADGRQALVGVALLSPQATLKRTRTHTQKRKHAITNKTPTKTTIARDPQRRGRRL